MKCNICGKKLEETFLRKPVGTIVKDAKGKKKTVCAKCQKELSNNKEEMLAKI